ncbi:AbrB/MazE/SpoVT family DNA-binding domain-containing protein [Halopenitus persicus]|uniref:AbrB/MazE/SpoVT family DNA-binding domain-containing protein n=1 Tax=Halopenitus persicus TaxID=1048396 RepID=UPI001E31C74A|nr:AbrB/MazE/SpoVT family DNA-binding domain-containing protein [Halopenitus persicus]
MFCTTIVSSRSTETDRQGRLYIPKEIREQYGGKYHIVTYEDRIQLIPVADDPLAAIREATGGLRDASIEEIREGIEAEVKAKARDQDVDR